MPESRVSRTRMSPVFLPCPVCREPCSQEHEQCCRTGSAMTSIEQDRKLQEERERRLARMERAREERFYKAQRCNKLMGAALSLRPAGHCCKRVYRFFGKGKK